MFTGIIEEVGTVKEAEHGRLVIACQKALAASHFTVRVDTGAQLLIMKERDSR